MRSSLKGGAYLYDTKVQYIFTIHQCRFYLNNWLLNNGFFPAMYSNHLNTKHLNTGFIRIPDSMGVQYSNGKVTWFCRPFEYQTFWTINRLFPSGFQTTIWKTVHLTTEHISTIRIQWNLNSEHLNNRHTWIKNLNLFATQMPSNSLLFKPSVTQHISQTTYDLNSELLVCY